MLNEALRTLTIPNTTMYNVLMKKLFSTQADEHLHITYDFNVSIPPPSAAIWRRKVLKRITKIFEKHGAIQFDTPLFVPKVSILALRR